MFSSFDALNGTPIGGVSFRVFLFAGIIVYLAVMLLIGLACSKKVRNVSDYAVADRTLALPTAVAALFASWFGVGSSMGLASAAFSGSLRDVVADPFAASLCLIIAGLFVTGPLRKKKFMTSVDAIQEKYGKTASVYAALWMLPVYVGWTGALILGLGTLAELFTGLDFLYSVAFCGAVVFAYTAMGGMRAVTITDLVQSVIIFAGLAVMLPYTLSAAGGAEKVFESSKEFLSILPAPEERNVGGMVYYFGSWMVMGLGCMIGQDLLQRTLSCKDEKTARASSIITGFIYFAVCMIPIAIGFAAKILFPEWGLDSVQADQVLPVTAAKVLGKTHPLLLALFFAALVSAIMSSAASSLLASSSLLVRNVITPVFPKAGEKTLVACARLSCAVFLLLSVFLALKAKSIYTLMVNCWASQLAVILVPVLASIYLPSAGKRTAWLTLGASSLVWVLYVALAYGSDDFEKVLTCGAVYGFATGLAACTASYLAFDRRNPSKTAEVK